MAPTPGAIGASPPPDKAQRGPGVWAVLAVLVILALAVFLALPFEQMLVQPWLPQFQAQLRATFAQAGPYAVVVLLGAIVGLAEITSTFPNYPREALRTTWARFLIAVNAAAAGLAFSIVRAYTPTADQLPTVIAVGLGFQALIRTKFTFAKQIGGAGNGDVSLNLGWLYEQFQNLCKTQIDLELMKGRSTAVSSMIGRYPSLAELHDIATYTILARATLTSDEEKARLAELDRLIDPKAPANFARMSMALLILENGGQAYVDLLLSQPMAPALPEITPESVARRLIEKYTLKELIDFGLSVPASDEVHDWVRQAAEPAPNVNEASQKAAIAYFLVQRVGAEAVLKELEAK
ncbi:MAG TPA: hypothetical protein VJ793_09420 [Anaerolineae bacterium]|nr:hypothetical protein [Anaerolineae bacterium]